MLNILRAALVLSLVAPFARPQATTGTILGTVRDASGGVIASANVTVTNADTKVSSTWTTNSSGEYTAPFLLPGSYQVAVDHPGFKKYQRSGITIEVAERSRVDVTLEIGAVSDTITATAEAPLVKADSSEVSQVIQEKTIQELPLNAASGRNFTALMTLVPGTIRTNPVGLFDAPQGNSSFVVNGTRDSANNYMIDGADNNESLLGIVAILPPPEALSEFNIQTSNYAAEFGRAGGAVINVQTRSGTNKLHGSLYEFLRNSAVDARGPFDGAALPPLRQNEYGGTFGGPILHDRTFFFTDYVGFAQRASSSYTSTVPTAAERQGVFLSSEGAPTIYNPLTQSPFPNNTIPVSMINPVSQKIINLYPAPNLPGFGVAGQGVINNFSGVSQQKQDSRRGDLRIDHTFSSKDSLFGRYSIFDANTGLTPIFGNVATGSTPSRSGQGDARDQNIIVGEVHTFSSNKINELRLAFTRIASSFTGFDYGSNIASSLGIPNLNVFGAISTGLPNIVVTGLPTNLGTDGPIPALRYEETAQLVDNFSLFLGKHSVKFGADLRRFRGDFFQISIGTPRGEFDFDQNFTSNNGAPRTGLGIASLLLGYPSAEARGVIYDFPSNVLSQNFFFMQDDYKVTSKLTLNVGLRYEIYLPPVDRHDNQSNFDTRTGLVDIANRGGNSRALVNTKYNYWAPRFGFAYSVDPLTVVRGGYGLSYFPDKFGATGGTLNTNYPFITLQQINAPSVYTPSAGMSISDGIPTPARPDLSKSAVPLAGNILAFDPNYKYGYFQFWNIMVQRQMGKQIVAEVAYVGTKGTHLFGNQHANLNQPLPGPGPINPRRPYYATDPLAGIIYLRDSSERSNYHSLQAKLQKRFTSGLFFLNSYTWSKAIDDAATSPDLYRWDLYTRGPANTDFRHSFTSSALYELPLGRGKRFGGDMPAALQAAIGGWQINGIYTFRTGLPSTASLSSGLVASTLNDGWTGRPNQISPADLPPDQRTLGKFFNTAAFAAPAANSYVYGNAGRNTIRGPNFNNFDFSLFKNFRFAERFNLQVRSEFFNVANHPNYANPNTSFGTASFGTITALTSNMRQIQFGIKLLF